jgi:DNA modification methylase
MAKRAAAVPEAAAIWVPIGDLLPWDKNPRKNDPAVEKIAESIRRFGFGAPILARANGDVIAGHTRLKAASKLGLDRVPVRYLDLDPADARLLALADNKLGEIAEWDEALLAELLKDIDPADAALAGFGVKEIADLLAEIDQPQECHTDPDEVPEAPDEPVATPGDLWLLGRHRLLCGDATNPADVERLMAGTRANLVFTDPPYGMSYGGGRAAGSTPKGARVKAHGEIVGDDKRGEALVRLVRDALAIAAKVKTPDAAIYVCLTWRTYTEFEAALAQAGLAPKACIVWDKKSIGLGYADYRPQHEFLFYCGGAWHGGKDESDVWQTSRGNTSEYVHPTQKPVELIERALGNSSRKGDAVLDLFGGSGSTLIACEKTGRAAYLVEIDPRYVDVIVRRWEQFTGNTAVLAGDQASATSA